MNHTYISYSISRLEYFKAHCGREGHVVCAIHLGHAQPSYLRYRAQVFLIVMWDQIDMHEWEGISYMSASHPSNIRTLPIIGLLPIHLELTLVNKVFKANSSVTTI